MRGWEVLFHRKRSGNVRPLKELRGICQDRPIHSSNNAIFKDAVRIKLPDRKSVAPRAAFDAS